MNSCLEYLKSLNIEYIQHTHDKVVNMVEMG